MTVYRPQGARIVAIFAAIALGAVGAVAWFAMPQDVRAGITAVERVTLALFLLAVLAILFGIARCLVASDEDGVLVVNGFRRHLVAWSQVRAIKLADGAPWATLDTTDGRSVMLLAIQSADGERARNNLRQLRSDHLAHRV